MRLPTAQLPVSHEVKQPQPPLLVGSRQQLPIRLERHRLNAVSRDNLRQRLLTTLEIPALDVSRTECQQCVITCEPHGPDRVEPGLDLCCLLATGQFQNRDLSGTANGQVLAPSGKCQQIHAVPRRREGLLQLAGVGVPDSYSPVTASTVALASGYQGAIPREGNR